VKGTEVPYLETFGCRWAVWNAGNKAFENEHDGDCEWGFRCGTCGRWLNGDPCPAHAPFDVPGLQLAPCDAMPRHHRTWFLATDTGYEPPCMYCAWDAINQAHAGCDHSHHGTWRRWRITHKVVSRLTRLGVLTGPGFTYSTHCRGCLHGFEWGPGYYLLGWPRWKWRCLLRARHWPGEEVLSEVCGKCAPCPECGSQRIRCYPDCPLHAAYSGEPVRP
jgi:hypothetical protein